MCGIAGFIDPALFASGEAASVLEAMTARIRHRGPDDAGAWLEPALGVGLGHRRLSILDLSPAGRQPMASPDGRRVICFNGEIYNHLELRERLGGRAPAWRGHSDTETLLACLGEWGLERTLAACAGMFAFALVDRDARTLTLVRDRLGEKPLYFSAGAGRLAFASELSALAALPGFDARVSQPALEQFMARGCVPGELSIYAGARKLRPGRHLTFDLPTATPKGEPVTYWSIRDARPSWTEGAEAAVERLEELLAASVKRQMLSDVALGAFLSGGVDSSTVVALMQAQASQPVKTFSIGFEDAEYDEAAHAGLVAQHLATDHTELIVSDAEAAATAPQMGAVWDEPFADSSQIPTLILARLTRRSVTVSLSGDGGDELFCGYDRYFTAARLEALPGKPALAALAGLVPGGPVEAATGALAPRLRAILNADRIGQFRQVLSKGDRLARYLQFLYRPELTVGLLAHKPAPALPVDWKPGEGLGALSAYAALDVETYLPDDILVKLDRAAMAVSLESRVPLLDHRIVEFAFSLPDALKFGPEGSKRPLRALLYRHVPRKLVERPKMGFSVPMARWLRGPLREWAGDLLSADALARSGVFDAAAVQALWRDHLAGRRDAGAHLWKVLSYQSWREAHAGAQRGRPQPSRA